MEPRHIFPADYMADPSAHVFDGKVYIYPSHDIDGGHSENDNGDHFGMRDYHVLRMDDINGEAVDCGKILNLDEIPWAQKQLWDNDCVEKDGRYYLIYSAKDKSGVFRLGVAVADNPEGPFRPEPDPIRGSYSIDPCAFKDDNGEIYCIFGGIWGGQLQCYVDNQLVENAYLPKGTEPCILPRIARMTDDVLQFAENPRAVVLLNEQGEPMLAEDPHHFFEASWIHKEGDKYILTYSTGDSHLLCYAEADNVYGPYTFRGVWLQPVVGWTSHGSICFVDGIRYLFHHDSVPSGGITWLRSLRLMTV